jgi:hypothetical protein
MFIRVCSEKEENARQIYRLVRDQVGLGNARTVLNHKIVGQLLDDGYEQQFLSRD